MYHGEKPSSIQSGLYGGKNLSNINKFCEPSNMVGKGKRSEIKWTKYLDAPKQEEMWEFISFVAFHQYINTCRSQYNLGGWGGISKVAINYFVAFFFLGV